MSSANLLGALEEERQRQLKAKHDGNAHASSITVAHRSSIAEKHATYSLKSRKYSRWVERQARKLESTLEKKRGRMERNQRRTKMGMDSYHAGIESLHAKIVKMETDRVAEEKHLNARLEEIQQEMQANTSDSLERANRSRAPSPEPLPKAEPKGQLHDAT